MARMAGNSWKFLEMAENFWNLLEVAGHRHSWKRVELLKMTGIGLTWLELAGIPGNGWK